MQITTILPVSRITYLDRVLSSLLDQTVKPQSLIVVFDGSDEDFSTVCGKVADLPFEPVICVKSTNDSPAEAIAERRIHIVNIHNQIRNLVPDETDYIFSIEDDGLIPSTALERLQRVAQYEDFGMATGVELGRWGVPYVGAWKANDVFTPTIVTSLENKTQSHTTECEEIDACGLYCAFIKAHLYKRHEFNTTNGLGPDVNLSLSIRQQGYKNYIDWGIPVTHLTNRMGLEVEIPATDTAQKAVLTLLGNSIWYSSKLPYGINLKNYGTNHK
jgi:glycosyltransferase involved in cell wall biosynthesis